MLVMYSMDDLFPVATVSDIKRAKSYLVQYKEKKRIVTLFEQKPPETDDMKKIQEAAVRFTLLLERAVDQILHKDVRAVIEYRFIKGNTRAATILRFSGWNCCDKTIDRKIYEGTVSVANTLMYLR